MACALILWTPCILHTIFDTRVIRRIVSRPTLKYRRTRIGLLAVEKLVRVLVMRGDKFTSEQLWESDG